MLEITRKTGVIPWLYIFAITFSAYGQCAPVSEPDQEEGKVNHGVASVTGTLEDEGGNLGSDEQELHGEAEKTAKENGSNKEVPAQPTFNIWQYEVRGVTVVDTKEVQKVLYPFLGPKRTLATVEEAANALIKLFDREGYAAAVDIPPQDVVNGLVVLQVVEGAISRVNVTGARYFLPSDIRKSVPSAQKGEVLQANTLQDEIISLNKRSGDLRVTPALSPGRRAGELEVDLRVYDELPISGSLTLNDHYSAYTTKPRLSGGLSFNNLWQEFHSVNLWGLISPEDTEEVKVYSLTYAMPVNKSNRLSLNYIKSDSTTDTLIPTANAPGTGPANGPASVAGDASIATLNYVIRPDFSDRTSFNLGINYKNVKENVTPDDTEETIQTPIEYFTLVGGINQGYSSGRYSGAFGLGFTASIRELNDSDQFADKRDNSRTSFFILNAYFNNRVSLPGDFALLWDFNGQYTESPLISNEQWRTGGSTSVRGYLESQELGDYGYNSSLQFETPSLISGSDHSLILHVFYDFGYAATQPVDRTVFLNPETGEKDPDSESVDVELSSYGLGLQYQYRQVINASVDWATALKNSCDELSTAEIVEGIEYCSKEGDVERDDSRVTFNISTQF